MIEHLTADPVSQIADVHTIFNIVTTLVLLPINIAEYLHTTKKRSVTFSGQTLNDLAKMKQINLKILEQLCMNGMESQIEKVEKHENIIDNMQKKYLKRQMKRIKKGNCKPEAGILFSELFTDFERIGDYALNIALLSADTSL